MRGTVVTVLFMQVHYSGVVRKRIINIFNIKYYHYTSHYIVLIVVVVTVLIITIKLYEYCF